MSSFQHRGRTAPGPFEQVPDPRVSELDSAIRTGTGSSWRTAGTVLAHDPFRAFQVASTLMGQDNVYLGLVIHALPSLGWYNVQSGNLRGTLPCCQLSQGGFVPVGPRDTSTVPPNSQVLFYKPRPLTYGFIIGVIPPMLYDGTIVNPDWLCQGGQSGIRREAVHQYPIQNFFQQGGTIDWSGQRPGDATSFERGVLSSTGIGWMVSDFEAWIRVHEQCGLFLNYHDGHTRLAALALRIESAVHELYACDDEGESRLFRGEATYPWEGLGAYAPGTQLTQTYSDMDVQYNLPVGVIDLPSGSEDRAPMYRYQEYGGYLGQGRLRMIALPAQYSGTRQYDDTDTPDTGLFCESIALDGSYSLRSAKRVTIGRRCKIIVPREARLPEDGLAGDDARAGNYKFSGYFGDAQPHLLSEIAVPGEYRVMRRLVAADDVIAFDANWKALHPFYYHMGDYRTAQESAQDTFASVQEQVDFSVLASEPVMLDPDPVTLQIDHRYTDAEFYQRESFLTFTDDGGVLLADGFGAEIRMGGGNILMGAPGDVQLCPGRDLLALAWQIILRAKQSVDVSASQGDLRLKADRNMQVLAGNSGSGGILLESKSTNEIQDYSQKIGEDVVSSGIVLRAPKSQVATLAGDIYLRTGGADLNNGQIVLDGGQGTTMVQMYASNVNVYTPGTVTFYYGPTGETSNVSQVYAFGADSCFIDASIFMGGSLIGFGGGTQSDIIINGLILACSDIVAGGEMADSGGEVGMTPSGFIDSIQADIAQIVGDVSKLTQAGTTLHQGTIVETYYQTNQIGNATTISSLEFSYRDTDDGGQYQVANLVWFERRWEQMVRLGGATGGVAWIENPVVYQGDNLYPWPGRDKWTEDEVFLQLANETMFDPETGMSLDRPGPYTTPTLADWDPVIMQGAYKLVR